MSMLLSGVMYSNDSSLPSSSSASPSNPMPSSNTTAQAHHQPSHPSTLTEDASDTWHEDQGELSYSQTAPQNVLPPQHMAELADDHESLREGLLHLHLDDKFPGGEPSLAACYSYEPLVDAEEALRGTSHSGFLTQINGSSTYAQDNRTASPEVFQSAMPYGTLEDFGPNHWFPVTFGITATQYDSSHLPPYCDSFPDLDMEKVTQHPKHMFSLDAWALDSAVIPPMTPFDCTTETAPESNETFSPPSYLDAIDTDILDPLVPSYSKFLEPSMCDWRQLAPTLQPESDMDLTESWQDLYGSVNA